MADQDIKMLIERIMAEARTHQSARFSNETYADEPILKTGRQMQNFLPDQYRKMREISRWQDDPKGGAGRWLSEAELFYRQGLLTLRTTVPTTAPLSRTFPPTTP